MNVMQGPSMTAIEALLRANELPIADLGQLTSDNFLFMGDAKSPVGVIGLEVFGTAGLLRSLVVSDASRGQGYAKALVTALELKALRAGVQDLFLLTETAARFFSNLDYSVMPRNNAPVVIKNTPEFSGLCPDDAILFHKQLVSSS